MSYEIKATFSLKLSDDLQEMSEKLSAATHAWEKFVEETGSSEDAQVHLELVTKRAKRGSRQSTNGSGKAPRARKKAEATEWAIDGSRGGA